MKKFTKFAAVLLAVLMLVSAFAFNTSAASFYETGDANCDGKVSVKDATAIQKYVAELGLVDTYTSDVNYDDEVTVRDATAVQKYIAGMGVTIEDAAGVSFDNVVYPTEPLKGKENAESDFLWKTLEDGTVHIIAYIGTSKDVTVPEKIDGKTVTTIGKCAFSTAMDLTNLNLEVPLINSLWIPDCVTTIGEGMAAYQTSLTDLRLPADIKAVPDMVALRCRNLVNFVVPSKVEKIGFAAFEDCNKMVAYTLPESCTVIEAEAFTRNDRLVAINLDKVKSIGMWAFFECNLMGPELNLASIETIDTHAFQACRSLTDVTIGDNCKEISGHSFKNCFKLVSVTLPEGLESIGELAFAATNAEESSVPAGCTVAEDAFSKARPEFY